MRDSTKDILLKLRSLRTHTSGERRAPHKPLLLLIAISNLTKGIKSISFDDVRIRLTPLLNNFAPPVKARHQAELPYWFLCFDGVWEISPLDGLTYQKGGFPTIGSLKKTFGSLKPDISMALEEDIELRDEAVKTLLEHYFPPSLHDDLLDQIGYNFSVNQAQEKINEDQGVYRSEHARDSNFRRSVLRAYEHECVVTGFRAALSGSYFGCEAAHVKWHAYHGPDIVSNGIALEPTMHKLFDAGAWTLTDDRRVLVSAEYTGSDAAIHRLRAFHGKPIKVPIAGESPVSKEFILWHRSPNLGGVFRAPALVLD